MSSRILRFFQTPPVRDVHGTNLNVSGKTPGGCAIHVIRQAGFILLTFGLLAVWPGGAWAWTSTGPWGGVIHDLKNAPAGAGTLYAATANGVYVYDGSLPWTQFAQTKGKRVLQMAPDPARGVLYAVARPGGDPFSFDNLEQKGTLYSLNLAAGNLTAMLSTEVSAVAVDGSGTLFAGANELFTDPFTGYSWIKGYIYRFSPGNTTPARITPDGLSYPIQALWADAASGTVYAARYQDGGSPQSDIIIGSSASGDMGWVRDYTLPAGERLVSLGSGAGGAPLAGTGTGKVYSRVSGVWQPFGTGLPPYPVTGFGSGRSGLTFAILRKHIWDNDDYGTDERPGLYYETSGFWIRYSLFDDVTTAVLALLPLAGDDWIAFDSAGIWRVPSSGLPPGEESDEGIAAVNLTGIVIDPESSDRALTFGPSGLYERLDGIWKRVMIRDVALRAGTLVSEADSADKEQGVREGGFLSAAFSADDPGVVWAGGKRTGLSRGVRMSPGSTDFSFDRLYFEQGGGQSITDILVDPFDSAAVYWSTGGGWGKGAFLTRDDGGTYQVVPGTGGLDINDLDWDLDEPQWRTALAAFGNQGSSNKGILAAESGGGSFYNTSFQDTSLYSWTPVTALAFNPQDLGSQRAVVGPYNSAATMAIINTGAGWDLDTTVQATTDLPPGAWFNAIKMPLGYDGDGRPDAFASLVQYGTGFSGLYHSAADILDGSPGAVWTDITGELALYGPTSVAVHPKNGNLLWATTRTGSAFTLMGSHFTDSAEPWWPGFVGDLRVMSSAAGDTLRVQAMGLAADTVVPGPGIPMVRFDARVTDTVDLQWTAPGDDGDMPGWADRYELYYSSSVPIADSSDFAGAWTAALPRPRISHRVESYSLNVVKHPSTWYSLAMVAYDEQNKASILLTTATNYSKGDGGTSIASVTVDLAGNIGRVANVRVYRDTNANETFETPGDSQIGSSSSILPQMTVPVSATAIGADQQTFFVVCDLTSTAFSGDSVSLSVVGITVDAADGVGPHDLPAWSGTTDILAAHASTATGGGGCFIATAAYGSSMAPKVDLFRGYRDRYLVKRAWGRALLRCYYTLSPGPAAFISGNPVLTAAARIMLAPILMAVNAQEEDNAVPVLVGFAVILFPAGFGVLGIMVLVLPRRSRRKP